MFRMTRFRTRKPARHSAPVTPPVVTVHRDTMARRQRPTDNTQVMPAVTDATSILPAMRGSDPNGTVDRQAGSAPLPPSQQPHPAPAEPWRPQVGGDEPWAGIPVSDVRHDRRSRQIFTDLPAEAPIRAEDSFQSLAAYDGPHGWGVRVPAVDASWFRTGVCDQTRFDALMERFALDHGVWVTPNFRDRPAGSLDTQEYTVVGRRQFSNDTYGKAAA